MLCDENELCLMRLLNLNNYTAPCFVYVFKVVIVCSMYYFFGVLIFDTLALFILRLHYFIIDGKTTFAGVPVI